MNTSHFNNKNMKRIAAGAGITAAALFLTAGLVAGIGGGNESAENSATPVTVAVNDAVIPEVADVAVVDEAAASVPLDAPVKATPATQSTPTKSTKQKKSTATGGNLIVSAPERPATTVAPAPAAASASEPVPANEASQPAAAQPTTTVASGSSTGSASTTSSGSTTWLKIPTFSGTPSVTSNTDLSKTLTTTVTIPQLCLSITC